MLYCRFACVLKDINIWVMNIVFVDSLGYATDILVIKYITSLFNHMIKLYPESYD
ncbi:hypothetical protein HanPI659440_Chr08g0305101 [Helianthus annuus]|nr:hypothetical protein HanPI659440_Chr08g0305101 [Helianthus annuus]